MAKERVFTTRYANWAPITVKVPSSLLENESGEGIVRHVVGHAFKEQLNGYWADAPDRRVVIDKDNPGVWIGRRLRDKSPDGKSEPKPEPFYVMEL